jgi:hypothetical protein
MLDQVAPKLRKLLLMLSSNKDGEVVNAARAIERTLRAANADWHDLTERLSAPRSPPPPPPPPPASWEAKRNFCLKHDNLLREREHAFVLGLGDWDGELTGKQASWLNAIYSRLKRRGRS